MSLPFVRTRRPMHESLARSLSLSLSISLSPSLSLSGDQLIDGLSATSCLPALSFWLFNFADRLYVCEQHRTVFFAHTRLPVDEIGVTTLPWERLKVWFVGVRIAS